MTPVGADTAAKATDSQARSRAPIDPRLWRYSVSARGYLISTVVLSTLDVVMVIVTALMLGRVLAGAITAGDTSWGEWSAELTILAAAVGARVVLSWATTRFADRAAHRVVAELKNEVLVTATRLPPRELDPRRDEIATVLTRGIDGLIPYLTGYLPALILVGTLTPATLAVIWVQDTTSALIAVVTLPLIPIFMVLIGLLTRGKSRRTLEAMTALSSQLLDLLAGLPTLRALGREQGPAARIRELGDAHRRSTMSALKIAFLSSMVLELLATLSVALIAVSIGLRLVFGEMALEAGIVALVLAPEVYLPLRMVGTRFHAAEDGLEAADRAFAVIDSAEDLRTDGRGSVPAHPRRIELIGVGVRSRSGSAPDELGVVFEAGRITALTGPNGSGKTTALHVVLALSAPDRGAVTIDGVPLENLERDEWWARIAWLPQHPVLLAGTVEENLHLTGEVHHLEQASSATGFDSVLAELPDGVDTVVGVGGAGMSLGQRQRLALTRVLATSRPVVLLDEPTAHLDDATEATVLNSIRALADRGHLVVVVAHRPSVLAVADTVVEVHAREE
ncbi:thiol reductant ABC exporter subunit CydD [Rhodococcus sp. NPDC058521]|uniref:thiol reductant ABC exporter subunit CydD n=1 Tax=Rhodococcus sp. NPDC058521 TaxID=3346536 RepID=UPI003647062D